MSLEGPPPEVQSAALPVLFGFAQRLQFTLLLHFGLGGGGGFALTSWWRGPARNAEVGGDPLSGHLMGLAADFSPPPGPPFEAVARALGLHVVTKPRVTHVQATPPPVLQRTGTLAAARSLGFIVAMA